MDFRDFWYVVEESAKLRANQVIGRRILDEWVAVFRDEQGRPVAMQDRCIHRNAQLSLGTVKNGCLTCPYHGWVYDGEGRVVAIPSLGPEAKKLGHRHGRRYPVVEQDGYVYVRVKTEGADESVKPFPMPHYGERGWHTLRLQNRFANNVTNCAENFVDIPHTAFVHRGIFRSSRLERLTAAITRKDGAVRVSYRGEGRNLGLFQRFLNPGGREIEHHDNFFMPNVTSVEYVMGPRRHFFITSQSVPASDDETLVYTDLTYNYGVWNRLAAPFVRRYGQAIIDQDIDILRNQMEVIRKFGAEFNNSPADMIHVFIESIRDAIAQGQDPRALPEKSHEIEFWV